MANRRPIKERGTFWARGLARFVARLGFTPNQISVLSVVFSLVGTGCFIQGRYWAAGLCIVSRLICNMLDGMVAVEHNQKSPSGEIFNELPDRLSDTCSLMGAGYAAHLPQVGLWASLLALLTAYIRTLCASAGAPADFGGPMAKQQRMKLLIGGCVACALWPRASVHILGTVLALITVGCLITCYRRASSAIRFLESQKSD
ncbi:MAG: CDP-alcohol phosphatidyltransferase family protein [Candidatus Eremiobacteraeota bacterium]|nr:CDP-alcohol phosphatidyltransferase family protein [Candidatus Eremiobacteraeota bacterium]MCW5870078.1 CDP-alcohol phosphatidyltransferase family protein [Candidatus Eremiobacteraeota bacterium]